MNAEITNENVKRPFSKVAIILIVFLVAALAASGIAIFTFEKNIRTEDVDRRTEVIGNTLTVVITPVCDIKNLKFEISFEKANRQIIHSKTETITNAIKGTEYRFNYDLLNITATYGISENYHVWVISGTKKLI